MPVLINAKIHDVQWFGDPPRFREVDEFRQPTGRVIKGVAARKLMHEINRFRGYDKNGVEVRGRLPKNWELDLDWENGSQFVHDKKGRILLHGGKPIPLGKGQRGPKFGRRIPVPNSSVRAVTVADTLDVVFVQWWKKTYPDIPYRPLSQDYVWEGNEFVTEVREVDVDIILLGCVGEFLDVTKSDDLPELREPIQLV